MSIPSLHYADLCDYAYKAPVPDPKNPVRYLPETIDGIDYEPLAYKNNPATGYQGTVYQRVDTGEIIVVHRGTEPKDFRDGIADAQMVARAVNPQFPDALELVRIAQKKAKEYAADRNKPVPEITVTGHSLGGALAELTAYHYGLRGETFNGYGAAGLLIDGVRVPAGGSRVINHVMATDVVSAGSAHFGEVRVYTTAQEIGYLAGLGGYGPDRRPGNPLTTAAGQGFAMHGISQFSRLDLDSGQPHPYSVLQDPQAQARAAQHAAMIEPYRHGVATTRAQITLGAQVGGLAGHAASVAVTVPAQSQAWALDAAGDVARVGAQVHGKQMEFGGSLTGQAIGGAVRGMGELAAQGGAVRGELAATVDHVQGVVQQRSTQGVADLLRGVAGLLPEEQRRHVEQMAGQLAHAGEQARIQQRAEAEATRRVAQDDAQQWRSQSQSLGDKIETHVRDSGRQIGEGIAVSGRRIDEQLDRGSQSLSQGVAQATQVGRVAGEGAGTVGVLVNRAAAEGVRVVAEQAAAHPSSYLHAKVGLPPSVAQAAPQASAPRAFSDPHHPQHALYNDLKSRLPAHISEDRLAQITAASHCGRVQAGRIDKLHVSESSLLVEGKLTGFANVDLTTPPPTQQHSLQQAQAYTQEQMERHQQLQQQRELQQEQYGPRMTLH